MKTFLSFYFEQLQSINIAIQLRTGHCHTIIHCNTSLFCNVYNHYTLHSFCDNYVYYECLHAIEIQKDSVGAKNTGVNFQLCQSPKFKNSLVSAARYVLCWDKKVIVSPSILSHAAPR
jgi:hypothetical protein